MDDRYNTLSCSFAVEVQFEQGHYSVEESDGHVEVCLTLNGMAQFPISFQITSGESSPSDAEGKLLKVPNKVCVRYFVFF